MLRDEDGATLVLRVWKAARLVRPAECEEQARLARPSLPHAEPEQIVEARTLEAPVGYDVRLVVGVLGEPARGVRGFALAIGAAVGRCYLAAYETEARGSDASARVAERLALAVEGVLETVEIPSAEAAR